MIGDFHSLPEYLKEMLPVLKHEFINIGGYSEEDIIQKIHELDGKGERIMSILQEREQKGLKVGIELGIQQGIEKGIERGIERGIEQGKMEMVKDLIRAGAEMDLIATSSKFPKEKIEEIKKEMLN